MDIKVKVVSDCGFPPRYRTPGSSGLDLMAVENMVIDPGETVKVRTGIAIELPPGYEAQIRPRSSSSAMGVLVHLGTVDCDFRGELKMIVTNLAKNRIEIEIGTHVAQLVIVPIVRVNVTQVMWLSETERGANGFGSTGR